MSDAAAPSAIDAVPLRHPWRWVTAAVILVVVALFLYGAATNPAYGWATFFEYLFNERVLLGVFNTIQLTVYSMVIGIVLGVVLTIMRLSGNPVMSAVAWVFLWVFRGTPVYVQLAFWGLLPVIYQNIQLGVPFGPTLVQFDLQSFSFPFLLAVLGLALNEAAYMAEIVRAGITSVPEGQLEASTALGMSWSLAMRRTVLPQAMRVIIPPTGNEVISLLKTTSLVTAVPYAFDLYSIATREIAARIFQPVPLLMVAAVWYLAITSVLMVGQFYLERYFSRGASRKLTDKQLEALAEAQGGDGAGPQPNQPPSRWSRPSWSARTSGRSKCSRASPWRFSGDRCWCWWARRGRASRRSCGASIISRPSMRAGSTSTATSSATTSAGVGCTR